MSRLSCRIESMEARLLYARALGLDVYGGNGTINWTSVAAAGKSFAFVKATESGTYYDTSLPTNANGAKNAGLRVGVYSFARPDSTTAESDTPQEQADFLYNKAKSYIGSGYMPPVLDLEDGSDLGSAGLSNWTNAFCSEVYAKSGVKPIIYCNKSYAGLLNSSVTQWNLWIADYNLSSTYATATPGTGVWSGAWKFCQYTSTGTVSGDSGNADLDVFNGTVADLDAYIAAATTPPAPKIQVQQSVTILANNQTTPIDFGTVTQGNTGTTKTFTVSNTGTADLTTSNVVIPAGYTVLDPLKATIGVSGSDSLTLQLNTAAPGTFAGNISFNTNVTGTSTFSFPITGKVLSNDTTPPTITAANYNYTSTTPSVSFTFSENVASSLSLSDFVVTNDSAGTSATPTSFVYDSSTNTATLGWTGALGNGNYTASVAAAGVSDTAGNVMSSSYAFGFFSLAGDINRDRKVDVVDLGVLSSHWQATSALFADGDLNHDGMVDVVDLGILSSNWQQSLPTPAQPDGLRVTSSPAAVIAKSSSGTVIPPVKTVAPVKKVATSLTPIAAAILV